MDIGFHHRGIDAQLAAGSDSALAGDGHQVPMHLRDGLTKCGPDPRSMMSCDHYRDAVGIGLELLVIAVPIPRLG
jgi:hypothetical protein